MTRWELLDCRTGVKQPTLTNLRVEVHGEKQAVFISDEQRFLQIDFHYFIHLRSPLVIGLLFEPR